MSAKPQTHFVQEMGGEGAPPRRNGELIFNEPWEGRAFGMAVALSEQGHYPWEEFRSRLIRAIGRWEREHLDREGGEHGPTSCVQSDWNYYERWLAAFEGLLLERGLVSKDELDRRTDEFLTIRRDEAFF